MTDEVQTATEPVAEQPAAPQDTAPTPEPTEVAPEPEGAQEATPAPQEAALVIDPAPAAAPAVEVEEVPEASVPDEPVNHNARRGIAAGPAPHPRTIHPHKHR